MLNRLIVFSAQLGQRLAVAAARQFVADLVIGLYDRLLERIITLVRGAEIRLESNDGIAAVLADESLQVRDKGLGIFAFLSPAKTLLAGLALTTKISFRSTDAIISSEDGRFSPFAQAPSSIGGIRRRTPVSAPGSV